MKKPSIHFHFSRDRFLVALAIMLIIGFTLLFRLVYLDEGDKQFLRTKANQESIHNFTIPASRGAILDRNGIPMAVSAPIDNIVFDPKIMLQNKNTWSQLANNRVLGLSYDEISRMVNEHSNSQFLYVKKGISPEQAQSIQAMKIPGVYTQQMAQTFYPSGSDAAQLIGFTDANNQGQDGLELAYNNWLKARPGREEVLESALGQILSVLDIAKEPQNGHDLILSIDSRIQYIAYQAIKNQVQNMHAKSGSAVVLDPNTGEILAAVSFPGFNPNDVNDRSGQAIRNRAITDIYEPGSVAKVFTIAAALESGKFTPTTPVDTRPGYYFLHGHKIRDDGDFGLLDVTSVLTKSSNVGVSKIALSLPHSYVYDMFLKAGFGQKPSGGKFPGEASGTIHPIAHLGDFEYATMTFGYAFSLSTLQLARAYSAIANGGILYPVSYVKHKQPPAGTRIMSEQTAEQLRAMLLTVTQPGQSGMLAAVPGYQVGGKTGTSHQAAPHGYYKNHYNSQFAGIVPLNHPRLVIVVHIDDPQGRFNYYGGVSAAPVFAEIAAQSLRILGIPFTEEQINQSLFKNQQRFILEITKA